MSCSSLAIRARSAAAACSAWRCSCRAPRGQRGGLPAGVDEHASQPEGHQLEERQCHARPAAAALREDQPQVSPL